MKELPGLILQDEFGNQIWILLPEKIIRFIKENPNDKDAKIYIEKVPHVLSLIK